MKCSMSFFKIGSSALVTNIQGYGDLSNIHETYTKNTHTPKLKTTICGAHKVLSLLCPVGSSVTTA